MGNMLFYRKKIVTEELEELQQVCNDLDGKIQKAVKRKNTVKWFSTYFIVFIIGFTVAAALLTVQDENKRSLYAAICVIAGGALIYCNQVLINSFYDWSIKRKKKARDEITLKKASILEKVKETETFKVAQELITKYDETSVPTTSHSKMHQTQRSLTTGLKGNDCNKSANNSSPNQWKQTNGSQALPVNSNKFSNRNGTKFPQPPRPFFKERSITEKFVDYILGDSINQRYALICVHCNEHNGMAREEDFDYISFHCWVCGEFNQARKQRIPVSNPVQITPFNLENLKTSVTKKRNRVANSVNIKEQRNFANKSL